MSTVGYARVSSLGQSLQVQLERLEAAGCERVYQEKRSGLDGDRRELKRAVDYLREGDTLVITKLDRLARSTLHLCQLVEALSGKGVGLRVLDQSIDTSTPTGKLLFHVLASIAEFETSIRRERQMEGIEKAKERGVYIGRQPTLTEEQAVEMRRKRHQDNVPIKGLMAEYGLSKASVYRYLGSASQAQATDSLRRCQKERGP
jgi:DNA invertase Pin-like site-specific DNA recombinase